MNEFTFTIQAGVNAGACAAEPPCKFSAMDKALLVGNHIIATDGQMLSVLPVTGSTPEAPMLLPAKAMKATAKKAAIVSVNGDVRVSSGWKGMDEKVTALPEQEGRFPPMAHVFPDLDAGYLAVALDVEKLWELASAVSPSKRIVLFVSTEKTIVQKPVAVVGLQQSFSTDPLEQVGIGVLGVLAKVDAKQDVTPRGVGLLVPFQVKDVSDCKQHYKAIKKAMPKESISFEKDETEVA